MKGNRSLFEISQEIWDLEQSMAEGTDENGELLSEVAAQVESYFAALIENQAHKLAGCVAYIQQVGMEAKTARELARDWTEKARTREGRVDWMKELVRRHLLLTGQDKVTTDSGYVVALQTNGAGRVEIDGIDLNLVPERFLKRSVAIDTQAVAAALQAGEELDWARLIPPDCHLRIR